MAIFRLMGRKSQDEQFQQQEQKIQKIDSYQSIQNQDLIQQNYNTNNAIDTNNELLRGQNNEEMQSLLIINNLQKKSQSKSVLLNMYNDELDKKYKQKIALFNNGNVKKIKQNQMNMIMQDKSNQEQSMQKKDEDYLYDRVLLFSLNIDHYNDLFNFKTRSEKLDKKQDTLSKMKSK